MNSSCDIAKTYRLPGDRARVFNAWISNDYAIPPVAAIVAEPCVGGTFRLHMSAEAGGGAMVGEFHEFRQDEHLQYTWRWNGSANVSIVDVRFNEIDSETEVSLKHTGLDTDDSVKRHADGWDAYILGLNRLLSER